MHDNIDESRVIIVNEEAVEGYSRFYRFIPRVDVEPPGFISKCINNNEYRHWRPIPQAMGGRPRNPARPPQEYVHRNHSTDDTQPYYRRRGFTAQEDQFLAEYIALRIPDKDAGGRMGNKIYQELEEHATEVHLIGNYSSHALTVPASSTQGVTSWGETIPGTAGARDTRRTPNGLMR